MKKIASVIAGWLLFIGAATAQSEDTAAKETSLAPASREGTITYDKTQVPCYIIDMPVGEDVAKEAIKKRFKQMGADTKERKGFMEFKNVSIPEISNGKLVDAYVSVDRKSKKDKDNSIVSLIITEPGIVPGAAPADGSGATTVAAGAAGLLSSLNENSIDYGVELDIKKQEEMVRKAEKEYKNLVDDGEDLQNKLKKTQNEIESNKNKQEKQADEVKKQKDLLLQAQAKRRLPAGAKKD